MGSQEISQDKGIVSRDILEETAISALLGVLGIDQSTDVGLQHEELFLLHRLLKGFHQTLQWYIVAKVHLLVEDFKNGS